LEKPIDMEVPLAPDVTPQQMEDLQIVLTKAGAETLIKGFNYILVERAPQF
jgi:hypothetical protein